MQIPQFTNKDMWRHMLLVLAAGSFGDIIHTPIGASLCMWVAWWAFEILRDPR
jgi:hypothetical protein